MIWLKKIAKKNVKSIIDLNIIDYQKVQVSFNVISTVLGHYSKSEKIIMKFGLEGSGEIGLKYEL